MRRASFFAEHTHRGNAMKRIWTIIGVSDVPVSFKWYKSLFGQPETAPSHDHVGQILDTDGTVLLCLHWSGAQERIWPSLSHHGSFKCLLGARLAIRHRHVGRTAASDHSFSVSGQIRTPAFLPASQSWRSNVASVIAAPTDSCHVKADASWRAS